MKAYKGADQWICAIDFGTSNSLICPVTPGREPVPVTMGHSADSEAILKSILFTRDGDSWHFGQDAVDRYTESGREGRIFRSLKKFLPDPSFTGTRIFSRQYSIADLIAVFLRELKKKADEEAGVDIKRAVFGRPAVFSMDPEKDRLAEDRLRAAAKVVGFQEVHFCPEPLAAAYEFRRHLQEEKLVAIADFGGGTSDFTILKMGQNGFAREDILAIGGVSVAGDAFDGVIMKNFLASHFGSEISYKMPLGSNTLSLPVNVKNKMCSAADISFLGSKDIARLLHDAARWSMSPEETRKVEQLFVLVEEHQGYRLFSHIEKAKQQLSEASVAQINFSYPGIDLHMEIEAGKFKDASDDRVRDITASLDETMAKAGVSYEDVDIVCCTGGTARVKALRQALGERFGFEKLTQYKNFQSVIMGLAHYGQEILGKSEIDVRSS